MKPFFQLPHNLQPHQSYFPMTFEKIFQNFCVKALVKEQKKLKYSPECFRTKLSEEFHKIYSKETVMKSFFS